MLDVIVQGGTVVTPTVAHELDIGILGERISVISQPGDLAGDAHRVVDARGKIVLPGGIEPHAHIGIPVPPDWTGHGDVMTQPPEAASRAAAHGGVTTIIDFAGDLSTKALRGERRRPLLEVLDRRRGIFRNHCFTDFAFHYILAGECGHLASGQIREALQEGVGSFKIFTTTDVRVPYGHLWEVFSEVGKHGGIVAVHAEEDEVVDYMLQKLQREGRDQPHNIHLAHNNLSEDLAFRSVIRLAEHTETGIYFVHTTAKEGVRAIADARRRGLPVYGEALHHYLHFTCEDYKRPDGMAVHTYPALKFADDRDALVDGLLDGNLSTTATDEYTTFKGPKLFSDRIESICGGHNGIETRIPVAFTKCVVERGMSLSRFANVIATNAAKILGLYPKKGVIQIGSDADLVLLDPTVRKPISLDILHAESDYSIWEGFECRGYPIMTLLRGKVIVEDEKLVGDPEDGRWISRRVGADVTGRTAL